jgi:hypothetical protein
MFLTAVICLIPRIPDKLMKAYIRISLPVNKLNMSSPEGDDNYISSWRTVVITCKYTLYFFRNFIPGISVSVASHD